MKAPDEKWPKIAYCNMNTNQETPLGYINLSPEPAQILFSAYTTNIDTKSGKYITFDTFLVNNGDDFNLSTGEFIAPVKGKYEFAISVTSTNESHWTYISVFKNGNEVLQFLGNKGHSLNSPSWILSLDSGDNIRLLNSGSSDFVTGTAAYCVFNGKLLELE